MAESDFQVELGRSFAASGPASYWKIPDMPHFLQKQANYKQKKPYDCFCVFGGVHVAMELKQKDGLSLKTRAKASGEGLTGTQEDNLLQVEEDGGLGLVLVNFLTELSVTQAAVFGVNVLNRSFAAPISALVAARRELAKDAIPLVWWQRSGFELQEIRIEGKPSWDHLPMLRWAYEAWNAERREVKTPKCDAALARLNSPTACRYCGKPVLFGQGHCPLPCI